MKQMIWSSYDLLDETAKEYYQNSQREILDDDCYEVSDEEWAEEVYRWLDDERSNLKDAMKKLPGIEVGDKGSIKYLGKEISNFYINGLFRER